MTTDQPLFPMAHTNPGIGPNIKGVCKSVVVTCEQSNLSITHVAYPRVQWHILFCKNKIKKKS